MTLFLSKLFSIIAVIITHPPKSTLKGGISFKNNNTQIGANNVSVNIKRPIVVDGEIKIRPVMYLALSYDHRIIDGKESVSFLKMIKENLEDPRRLFLDI